MHHCTSKNKELVKRIAVYALMALSVFVLVTTIVFFMMGFRIDTIDGKLEQYALLQFNSVPTGAKVTVDGESISSRTPTSSSVPAGEHKITISRDGYQTWSKTVDVKSGVLKWLKYAILVPNKLAVESVANYDAVYASLASSKGHYMLVEGNSSIPTFDLVDLSSDTVKMTKLTIATTLYSEAATPNITHTFQIKKWDDGGRYVLIKHIYGDKYEWLVLDTQIVDSTKNITKLFDFAISDIDFFGTSGNLFYALGSNNIRKLDLSAGTISRTLVGNVTSFNIYNSSVITYNGTDGTVANLPVVGIYNDGDSRSYVLRTKTEVDGKVMHISASRYFNENYIAISDGQKVDILRGAYPNNLTGDITSLALFNSFTLNNDISELSFSPDGQYILAKSGAYFASYDLEYKKLASSIIEGNGTTLSLKWLNKDYLWSDRDGSLTIREFDGANIHIMNVVAAGQDVVITNNGRYLYSVNKSTTGYQLQRVRMILP